MNEEMTNIQHIHFVGIKGVGMTPLAVIAKEAGMKVTGSDLVDVFITDIALQNVGITPFVGFDKEHISGADLVITTGAHGGFDNVEVQYAQKQQIPVLTQGKAVGVFMDGSIFGKKFIGISIAGTHGKTTTSAMTATVLKSAGKDPSFLIGTGSIPSLGSAGHFGTGEYFVAEADEYATEPKHDKTTKFLWQKPTIAVITNIELDHPDVYDSVEDMRKIFLQFANQLPASEKGGVLIACGDDHQVQKLLKEYKGRVVTYGFSPSNDYVITKFTTSDTKSFFWLDISGHSAGEFVLNINGEHNALNALAAIIIGIETGLTIDACKKAIQAFTGTKRRMEYLGKTPEGLIVYDDYGHHPTEISKTLSAFKKMFPKKHLVCVFQPHTYSRTKALFQEFIHCFSDADTLLLTDIYASAREKIDMSVTSEILAQEVSKIHKNVHYLPKLTNVIEYLNEKRYKEESVLITMGAGDVYKITEELSIQK